MTSALIYLWREPKEEKRRRERLPKEISAIIVIFGVSRRVCSQGTTLNYSRPKPAYKIFIKSFSVIGLLTALLNPSLYFTQTLTFPLLPSFLSLSRSGTVSSTSRPKKSLLSLTAGFAAASFALFSLSFEGARARVAAALAWPTLSPAVNRACREACSLAASTFCSS